MQSVISNFLFFVIPIFVNHVIGFIIIYTLSFILVSIFKLLEVKSLILSKVKASKYLETMEREKVHVAVSWEMSDSMSLVAE